MTGVISQSTDECSDVCQERGDQATSARRGTYLR